MVMDDVQVCVFMCIDFAWLNTTKTAHEKNTARLKIRHTSQSVVFVFRKASEKKV